MPTHEQPAVNRNPAQAEIDPDQLTAQGTPGADTQELADLADAQTAGSRNPRVMNVSNDKRAVEPIAESTTTAYDSSDNAHASGITNQPLAKEKASQAEVGSEQKPAPGAGKADSVDTSAFPKGMAEVTDTVEISTEKPKH